MKTPSPQLFCTKLGPSPFIIFLLPLLFISCAKKPASPQERKVLSEEEIREALEEKSEAEGQRIDQELAKWEPDAEHDLAPMEVIRDLAIDIKGAWNGRTGLATASMFIVQTGPAEYEIEFYTSGCLSRWRLHRNGTLADGVLMLDRPVREYVSTTFNKMYTVRIAGKECLLPAPNVAELQEDLNEDGTPKPNTIGVSLYAYSRKSEKKLLYSDN